MIRFLTDKRFFWFFICVYASVLCAYPSFLSISYDEAHLFFYDQSYMGVLARFSCQLFGQNDFALRFFPLIFSAVTDILFFAVARKTLKKDEDARVATLFFLLLPATNLSALLVMKSSFIACVTLLFIYLYERGNTFISFAVLCIDYFFDGAFAILYLALVFFSVAHKDSILLGVSIVLFGVSMGMFGFDTGGIPQSYFLDTLGVYLLVFSPFLFIYFAFALYKTRRVERPIGWYISFWALLFSLLLSFRQKIHLYDFAPYVIIAVPFMVRVFMASYRVRIGENKTQYRNGFTIIFASLVLFTVATFFNKPLYYVLERPQTHFAYNYQIAKELAIMLKKRGITRCEIPDEELALRLRFYGIMPGGNERLEKHTVRGAEKLIVAYYGRQVGVYYLSRPMQSGSHA